MGQRIYTIITSFNNNEIAILILLTILLISFKTFRTCCISIIKVLAEFLWKNKIFQITILELGSYFCLITFLLYKVGFWNLFLLKEYLDNNELIKIVDLALNNIDLTTIQNRINLFNSNIKEDLELLFSDYFTLNDFLSLIQSYNLNLSQIFDQKFVEKYLRRFVQRDYNILSGVDSSDVLKTTDGYVRITNKESLKVQPYELIMPKIFINEFGLN